MTEKSLDTFHATKKDFLALYGENSILVEIQKVVTEQQRRLLSQLKK